MSAICYATDTSPREQLNLLNEIFALTANRLRGLQLRWHELPLARRAGERNVYNAQDWMISIQSGTISFPRIANRHFRKNFPEYKAIKGLKLAYSTPLSSDTALVLKYEKTDTWAVTRTFHVLIGIMFKHETTNDTILLQDISSCLDQGEERGLRWEYNGAAELEKLLDETAKVISIIMPAFKDSADRLLKVWPSASETAVVYGNLSFKQACSIATSQLQYIGGNYSHIRAAHIGMPHFDHSFRGSDISLDRMSSAGTLSSGEYWIIQFADIDAARTIKVCIPHTGHIRFMQSYSIPVIIANVPPDGANLVTEKLAKTDSNSLIMCDFEQSTPSTTPPSRHDAASYADSTDVVAVADAAGGTKYKEQNSNAACSMFLTNNIVSKPMPAYWRVVFHTTGEPLQRPLVMDLSATNPVSVIKIRNNKPPAQQTNS